MGMESLTRAHFETVRDEFDEAVLRTPYVDRFCTSSAWILPAHDAFHPDHNSLFLRNCEGWAALHQGVTEEGVRYWAPLEAMWGLASPIVGPAPGETAQAMAEVMATRDDWDILWLCGLAPKSDAIRTLAQYFSDGYRLGLGPRTIRHVASLEGGLEGFIARRSPRFRASIRRTLRRAEAEGVQFEHHTPGDEGTIQTLLGRIMAIEARSWKGISEAGINVGTMRSFYEEMLPRLAASKRLRLVIGRWGDQDVAYAFGAVFGNAYRGLQMSFVDDLRGLSLGNLAQITMIRALAEEGIAAYDLGSDIAYKRRWSDGGLETIALVIMR